MKLIELAEQHNLDQEILREVVEEDLNISLSKGMDTPMKQAQVDLILSQNGLETVDGEEFKPILSQAAQEKQKRSQAAKKLPLRESAKKKKSVSANKKLSSAKKKKSVAARTGPGQAPSRRSRCCQGPRRRRAPGRRSPGRSPDGRCSLGRIKRYQSD